MSGRQLEPSDYEGAQLTQMREWIEGGSGADGLYSKAETWRGERKFMAELAERVRGRMSQAGAVTEGQAGEAMQGAVSPVVLWTEVTAENVEAQAMRTTEQGAAFSKVKTSIPAQKEEVAVPEETSMGRFWSGLTNGKTDNEEALEQNEKLRQEAVTAFNGYHGASEGAVGASAVFSPPPERGMQTVVESKGHQPVGQQDSSVSPNSSSGLPPANSNSSWSGNITPGNSIPAPAIPPETGPGSRPPAGTGSVWTPQTPPSGPGSRSPGPGRTGPKPGGDGFVPTPGGAGNTPGPGAGRGAGPGTGAGSGTGRGAGSGAGSGVGRGAGAGAGSGTGRSLSPGGSSGVGGSQGGRPVAGAGATGGSAGGARGAGGPMGGAGRGGQQGEEEEEHYTPEFLKDDHGFFDDDMPRVAPPVFGDWSREG